MYIKHYQYSGNAIKYLKMFDRLFFPPPLNPNEMF